MRSTAWRSVFREGRKLCSFTLDHDTYSKVGSSRHAPFNPPPPISELLRVVRHLGSCGSRLGVVSLSGMPDPSGVDHFARCPC